MGQFLGWLCQLFWTVGFLLLFFSRLSWPFKFEKFFILIIIFTYNLFFALEFCCQLVLADLHCLYHTGWSYCNVHGEQVWSSNGFNDCCLGECSWSCFTLYEVWIHFFIVNFQSNWFVPVAKLRWEQYFLAYKRELLFYIFVICFFFLFLGSLLSSVYSRRFFD